MNENEIDQNFPSLKSGNKTIPFGWVQWKGTDVCLDIHCECGERTHYDGDFCYHIRCGNCGLIYECDGHIKLNLLNFEPEFTKTSY